jgi:hypothetical protein
MFGTVYPDNCRDAPAGVEDIYIKYYAMRISLKTTKNVWHTLQTRASGCQKLKCNPSVIPTSIVFKNKNDAFRVFGFSPTIANFDKKTAIFRTGNLEFIPKRQVQVLW